jgi:hypothetical protein
MVGRRGVVLAWEAVDFPGRTSGVMSMRIVRES